MHLCIYALSSKLDVAHMEYNNLDWMYMTKLNSNAYAMESRSFKLIIDLDLKSLLKNPFAAINKANKNRSKLTTVKT